MTDQDHPTGLWNLSSLTAPTPAPDTPPSPSPSPSSSSPASPPVSSPPASAAPEAWSSTSAAPVRPVASAAQPFPVGPVANDLPDSAPPASSSAPPLVGTPPSPVTGYAGAGPAAGRGRLLILAGSVVALLVAAGGVGLALRNHHSPAAVTAAGPPANVAVTATDPGTTDPETTDPEPTDPGTTEPATEATETTTDPQAAALASLEQTYEQDRDSVSFTGQYAAQIASKYPGIVDKLQTTATGSHRFEATDILAEYQQLSTDHGSSEHPVILLKSTDYGKRQRLDGHFLWVTFAVGDFPDAHSVHAWCDAQFATLSTSERDNQCAVRRLEPGR